VASASSIDGVDAPTPNSGPDGAGTMPGDINDPDNTVADNAAHQRALRQLLKPRYGRSTP
jgi:hypothetical protein